MSAPDTGPAEAEAVGRVLRSGRFSQGPFLEEFERRLREYLGTSTATAVSSGTAGLHLALRAAGVGPGDLVLTSSFSFVATANAIVYLGARPIFVDVERETGNLSPVLLEERLKREANGPSSARLKAVLPVHVFGQPADIEAINRIARQFGLSVVEDACEALGSESRDVKVGTLGDAAVFGFYPNKQLTTGEGGAVATRREDWAENFRCWRNQGRGRGGRDATHVQLGYNYRLDEFSAALGAAQMGRIEELLANRERTAALYRRELADLEEIELPSVAAGTTRMSWFVYVIRARSRKARDFIGEFLAGRGIPTRVYFEPIHLQPFYRELAQGRPQPLRETERLGARSLALPFSGVMSERQVQTVAEALRGALAAFR